MVEPSALRMTKIPLNHGAGQIPALGFGTLIPDPAVTITATRDALQAGFRHFDCAERYGNEREVGTALQAGLAAEGIAREDVFVTTKLWNSNHRPERVEPAFQARLERLGLKYLDLYLIHTPFAFQPGDDQDPRDQDGNVLYDAVTGLPRGLESSTLLESVLFSLCSFLGRLDALVHRAIANQRSSCPLLQQFPALVFINSCGSNFRGCEVRWSSEIHRNSCTGFGACGIPHRRARYDESKPFSKALKRRADRERWCQLLVNALTGKVLLKGMSRKKCSPSAQCRSFFLGIQPN
jgi:hypothetical protein